MVRQKSIVCVTLCIPSETFNQWFDTTGWVTERATGCKKGIRDSKCFPLKHQLTWINTEKTDTLNNASDYRANGLLSAYIGWTNGLSG